MRIENVANEVKSNPVSDVPCVEMRCGAVEIKHEGRVSVAVAAITIYGESDEVINKVFDAILEPMEKAMRDLSEESML